jgi:RNA recognition motif-containing protein
MPVRAEAEAAVRALDGQELKGRKLRLSESRPELVNQKRRPGKSLRSMINLFLTGRLRRREVNRRLTRKNAPCAGKGIKELPVQNRKQEDGVSFICYCEENDVIYPFECAEVFRQRAQGESPRDP